MLNNLVALNYYFSIDMKHPGGVLLLRAHSPLSNWLQSLLSDRKWWVMMSRVFLKDIIDGDTLAVDQGEVDIY